MMPEKYPTWLEGHVKEWTEKRLPTVTLCSLSLIHILTQLSQVVYRKPFSDPW